MENKKQEELRELSEKILQGVRDAVRKLVEEAAANDECLVIGDGKGNIMHVHGKILLKELENREDTTDYY